MSFIEIVEDDERFELTIGESNLILRRFDSEAYRKIEKRHTTRHKNLRLGTWITEVDEHALNDDLLDYMICDWQGVKSPKTSADVPCTREMKLKLPSSVKVEIIAACDADHITEEKKTNSTSSKRSSNGQ